MGIPARQRQLYFLYRLYCNISHVERVLVQVLYCFAVGLSESSGVCFRGGQLAHARALLGQQIIHVCVHAVYIASTKSLCAALRPLPWNLGGVSVTFVVAGEVGKGSSSRRQAQESRRRINNRAYP